MVFRSSRFLRQAMMPPRTSTTRAPTWRTTELWKSRTTTTSPQPPAVTLTAVATTNANSKKKENEEPTDTRPQLHLLPSGVEVPGAPLLLTGQARLMVQLVLKLLQNELTLTLFRLMPCKQPPTPQPPQTSPDPPQRKGPIRGLKPIWRRRGGWQA